MSVEQNYFQNILAHKPCRNNNWNRSYELRIFVCRYVLCNSMYEIDENKFPKVLQLK